MKVMAGQNVDQEDLEKFVNKPDLQDSLTGAANTDGGALYQNQTITSKQSPVNYKFKKAVFNTLDKIADVR